MTDAHLVAYRWGQQVGAAKVVGVMDGHQRYQPREVYLGSAELAVLERIGRAAFRYWALRGANVP